MNDDLSRYLSRIGVDEPVAADLATLRRVHRAHARTIAYENLDVQLGVPVTSDSAHAIDKIARRGRGGWCYEQNGMLGAALEAIGFRVTRMAGGVMRAALGDQQIGNHLVLRVDLDRPYLCDVGFADGMIDPVPLAEGSYTQGIMTFRLARLEDGMWRFHNHENGAAPSFDFADAPADEALLAQHCQHLQTAPDSMFVLNALFFRHVPEGLIALRGKALRRITAEGIENTILPSPEAYVATLRELFDLDVPEAASLWPRITARHDALLAAAG
ncbi:MAG: arylamine N-acetyltransferase [Alphaproteobacteria bacterium]|nr:arylamine N-acetyltransferase [Alphaproteobacteria bacterium]